jgi:hypothetical protein
MSGDELSMATDGICVSKGLVAADCLTDVKAELLSIATSLGVPVSESASVDTAWNWLRLHDRPAGGRLYNAFKRLPSVYRLATSTAILSALRAPDVAMKLPMLVDVNCRIDSFEGDKFLFDWHQDYWFSICSPNAVVVWMPLTDVVPETGGLEVISNRWTGGKIYDSCAGKSYNSYADAVKLNDSIPDDRSVRVLPVEGEGLLFRFSVLHRSGRVATPSKSRFTVQLRFADGADEEFLANDYKPGTVASSRTDYVSKTNNKGGGA